MSDIDNDTLTQTTCPLNLLKDGAVKYDDGKSMGGTLYEYFPRALEAVADVSTFGAKKYARGGWAFVENGHQRYTDAMHRHLLQEAKGEVFDVGEGGSGLRHAAHAAWGALCRLELELRKEEHDKKKSTDPLPTT